MRVVIVGTGTEVGKTHLGVTLVRALVERGVSVCGLKPVESGVPAGEVGPDGAALAAECLFHVKHPQPYAFADPVSPHLAARREGAHIGLERVRAWVDEHPADWVIVETAGALLSPLDLNLTNLDLGHALDADAWVLVGVDRLGALHDVAACRLAMRYEFPSVAPCVVVVLQTPAVADSSTGTNAAELQLLGSADKVFVMPRGAPRSPGCQRVARAILECLGGGV